jgi:hypothetical protein
MLGEKQIDARTPHPRMSKEILEIRPACNDIALLNQAGSQLIEA